MVLSTDPDTKQYSFAELDALLKIKPKDYMWNPFAIAFMHRLGWKSHLIEGFDYRRLAREGAKYFSAIWTPERKKFEQDHISLPELRKNSAYMIRKKLWTERPATLEDVKKYFNAGWLVSPVVNARALLGMAGFSNHVVLITNLTATHVTLNDPGLPPKEGLKVTWEKFASAFQYTLRAWKR